LGLSPKKIQTDSKMRNLFLSLFVLTVLFSCKEELVQIPVIDVVESPRVILIEELTGVSCPNCPVGTEKLAELKNTFGKNIVIVGVHGAFLSWPTDESKYDFRFENAMKLENYLKPWSGKPAASLNRTVYSDVELSISNPQLWGGIIQQELKKEHRVNVDLETVYDEGTNMVGITVNVLPVSDFAEDEELRETFNFAYEIPTPADGEDLWRPEHMEVVAFIHSNKGGKKEVFQAAEKKIIE